MNTRAILLLIGGGALIYLATRDDVQTAVETGVDTVTAALTGWKAVQQGPVWVPVINQTEAALGIPTDLLARIAYQESRFRPDVISGLKPNATSGALGMMQMLPKYFQSVNAPRPYSQSDIVAQITEAGQLLTQLYSQFGDWALAIAAYNDGATNIRNYLSGARSLPTETSDYVSAVLADVPVGPNTLQA